MNRTSSSHNSLLSPPFNSNEPTEEPLSPATVVIPEINRQQAVDLVHLYFDAAVISYRFLNSKLIFGWIENVVRTGSSALSDSNWLVLGHYKSSILFMIFATALHYQEVSGVVAETTDGLMSKPFLATGRQCLKRQRHHHRLETVQARLAYSIYLLANSKLEASWYVLGRTVQILTALGMHRATYEHHLSCSDEIELFRRCFWTSFTLDHYVSIILGRPHLIFDDLFDQLFPERIEDERPDFMMSKWATSPKFGLNCLRKDTIDCSMDAPYFMYRYVMRSESKDNVVYG